ncbi:MAG: NAD(P)H-hydrate dehydratase [Nanoarchaeota archaeon]
MNFNQVKKLMDRKKTSRKGENGHALVIGGSDEYVGAVVLAGLAALRAGCDTATVAAPEKVAWAVHQYTPDLMSYKVKGTSFNIKNAKEMVKYADKFDAVLIGNGITRKADKFCQYFVHKSQKLKVIDSDALKTLSFKDFNNSIITLNETELETMLVNSNKEFLLPKLREANAKEKAEILQGNLRYFLQNNNVLLVKGPTDLIISANKISYNRTGNQGMTKGGTGDILAGLAAGFLAKSRDLFKSAVAASFINGLTGDLLLKKKKGYTFLASDILEDLAKSQKVDKQKKRR